MATKLSTLSKSLQGFRKIITCAMGLASLLVLAVLVAKGGLPNDALNTLSWAIVFLTGTALGANVGEHAFKAPEAVTAIAAPDAVAALTTTAPAQIPAEDTATVG